MEYKTDRLSELQHKIRTDSGDTLFLTASASGIPIKLSKNNNGRSIDLGWKVGTAQPYGV